SPSSSSDRGRQHAPAQRRPAKPARFLTYPGTPCNNRGATVSPDLRHSGPGRCGTVWPPRERFELVEKLRDVVLNCPDYLSTVLCRDRRIVEARHPGGKSAQSYIAHNVCAEERVAGGVTEQLVAGEH